MIMITGMMVVGPNGVCHLVIHQLNNNSMILLNITRFPLLEVTQLSYYYNDNKHDI